MKKVVKDKGPWFREGKTIFSDDFLYDVRLRADGDWGLDKEAYLDWLVAHLNRPEVSVWRDVAFMTIGASSFALGMLIAGL